MKTKYIILLVSFFLLVTNSVFSLVNYSSNWSVIPLSIGSLCGGETHHQVTFRTDWEVGMDRYRIIRGNSSSVPGGPVINSTDGDGGWVNSCGTCNGKTYTIIDDTDIPYGLYHYWVQSQSGGWFGGYDWHYIGAYPYTAPHSKDWTNQVATLVTTDSSPSNLASYSWNEESITKQGAQISLLPSSEADIFLEQNNNIIKFITQTGNYIIDLQVNIDNQGWTTLYNGSSKLSHFWHGSNTFSLGEHTLKVRWIDAPSGQIYDRTYHIHVVPTSSKLFKDNYCNVMKLWEGSVTDDAVPVLISEGFDAYNTSPPQFIASAGNEMFNCLKNAGFKIYVLNYKFNSQDMRNNAAVYAAAIKHISAINGNKQVIAGGISMGGIIARYAVAKAEGVGTPLPISKFITIDSPHQGAVVSSDLQDYTKDNSSGSLAQHGLNNPAARQLLTYNSYGSLHASFYNELNNLNGDGYPHNVPTIGVSFSTSAPNPNSGDWLRVTWHTFLIPGTTKAFNLSSEEKQAGSYLPSMSSSSFKISKWWWANSFLTPTVSITQYLNPTFISHNSSLDIVNGQSKFDITIQPAVTGFHDEVPSDIIEPLLNALLKENVYIQNKTVTSNNYYIGKNITAGNNVTNSIPIGNLVINADVTFHATQSIVLAPGFSTQTGSNFQTIIAQISCNTNQGQQYRPSNTGTNLEDSTLITGIPNDDENKLINNDFELNIYPNPTDNTINLAYQLNESGQVVISIIDIKGQQLKHFTLPNSEGINTEIIDLKSLPKGVYFLQFISKSENITKRIIKL